MNREESGAGLPSEETRLLGSEEPVKRSLPVVCRMLRTKTGFGSMQPGGPDWRTGDSTTAVYWCLQTMETAGIDGGYAHPHTCCEGRDCFVRPAGLDPIA
jgi:hypothetical protein